MREADGKEAISISNHVLLAISHAFGSERNTRHVTHTRSELAAHQKRMMKNADEKLVRNRRQD